MRVTLQYYEAIDERDDAQGGTALGALERIDLVHLLNQPGPVGLAAGVGRPAILGPFGESSMVSRRKRGPVVLRP